MSDNFENGFFWELYKDLERQFQSFLEYVPYLEYNENVYSFKLLNLILSIGGHIDSAFKEMARYPQFSNNEECQKILDNMKESEENIKKGKTPKTIGISLCLRAFEKEYKLSKRRVKFKCLPKREDVTPFKPYNPRTKAPEWWEIYNGLKHDVSLNIQKANLRNTRDALAAAFLLNVSHKPAAIRLYDYNIMKPQLRKGNELAKVQAPIGNSRKTVMDMLENQGILPGFTETPLFIFNHWIAWK